MSPSHSIKQKSKLNNSSLHFNWCSIPNTWLLLSESGMIVIETTRKTVYMIMQYYIAQCITVSTIFLLLILHKHQMMKLLNAEWQLLNFMASLLSLVIVNPHIYSSWTCLKRYLLFLGYHEHRLPLVSFLFCQYVSSAPINFFFCFSNTWPRAGQTGPTVERSAGRRWSEHPLCQLPTLSHRY